jgi:type III restriction enzyme
VRNVERQKGAFSLQTSRGRFFPDFVVKLKSGKIVVLEYKGAQLVDKKSEVEKNDIGQLWERRANQACGFGMILNKDWASLDLKLTGN